MMMKKFVSVGLLTLLGITLTSHAAKAQLSVTHSLTAQQLLDLLIDPTDSTITVIPGSVTYVGAPIASGSFTGGTSDNVGLGINSGLILTSGRAVDAIGPNNSDGTSTGNNTPGDANLSALIGGAITRDAASLQFSFTTTTGNLSFNYQFASEEYNEFVFSFNDVFGFFLDGVNIAKIPGINTPVSIDNVNGGNPFGTNPTNSQFYNNNDLSDGGPFFNIQYDGFTKVFTASASGLGAGTHTIKLAVADAIDSLLDSAVFIEGGSFSGEPPQPPTTQDTPESSSLLSLLGIGVLGIASAKFRKK